MLISRIINFFKYNLKTDKNEIVIKQIQEALTKEFMSFKMSVDDLMDPDITIFYCHDNGKLIYCAINEDVLIDSKHIINFAFSWLDPDYRGNGIGKQFFGKKLRYFSKKGFDKFTMKVRLKNQISLGIAKHFWFIPVKYITYKGGDPGYFLFKQN